MNKLIVLIITHKSKLTALEKISISQCNRILGSKYPISFVVPKSLNTNLLSKEFPNFNFIKVNDNWMKNYHQFNQMKIQPHLYKKINHYEFVLFYEPDAFIFKDDMEFWMNKNYDYIGAPWFEGFQNSTKDSPLIGVGNGGFSLRKISSIIKATSEFHRVYPTKKIVKDIWNQRGEQGYFLSILRIFKNMTIGNNIYHLFNNFKIEDTFWGLLVPTKIPWFKIAPIEEAMLFSFEVNPKELFKRTKNKLPTGCHGWWKYDLDFWKEHIEHFGYNLPESHV